MTSDLSNSIMLLLLFIVLIGILLVIALSFLETKLRGTKSNGDTSILEKLVKDDYAIRGINFALLIILSLTYLEFFNLFYNLAKISKPLSILITALGGSLIIIIFTLLPLSRFSENNYENILVKMNKFIKLIKYILLPFVYIYSTILAKLFKTRTNQMTEDELLVMVDRAEQEFGINQNESRLIKSVLDFDELKVLDIYTPRVDLVAVEFNDTNENIIKTFRESGFSRLPVYEDNIDTIVGILNHKDFYNKVVIDKGKLEDVLYNPLEVTEYMDLTSILALLKKDQGHLAVVKDEYGGTLGVVTMEDILEELVGDIWDEHDHVVEAIQLVEDNKYLVHGSTYMSDLIERLDLEDDEELQNEDYITVNGWITSKLGKIGAPGDSFLYGNLDVKVITANQKKVFEVIINIVNEEK